MNAECRFQASAVVLHPRAEVLVGGVDVFDPFFDGGSVRVALVDQRVSELEQELHLFPRLFGFFLKRMTVINDYFKQETVEWTKMSLQR